MRMCLQSVEPHAVHVSKMLEMRDNVLNIRRYK